MPVEPSSEELAAEPHISLVHHPQRLPANVVSATFVGDCLCLTRATIDKDHDPCFVVILGELIAPADLAEVSHEAHVKQVKAVLEYLVVLILAVLPLDVHLQLFCAFQTQRLETESAQSVVVDPDKLARLAARPATLLQLVLVACDQLI